MLDEIDKKLLQAVQRDAKMSYAELGAEVGLSVSPVNERLKKLVAQGVIQGWTAIVDPTGVGLDICAFIQVAIDRPEDEKAFLQRVAASDRILECHHVTGEFSYLLKVRARDTAALEKLIRTELKSDGGVTRSHTTIVLSTAKETARLPVGD